MGSSYRAADLVADLRKQKGMTQAQFGNLVGVTQSLISQWESGSANPSEDAWMRMATYAPYPQAKAYYAMAGAEGRRAIAIQKSVGTILEVINKFDSARGSALKGEITGLDPDAQLERVTQALVNIIPGEARTDWKSGLSPEDRSLVERFEAALKKLESWGERPK